MVDQLGDQLEASMAEASDFARLMGPIAGDGGGVAGFDRLVLARFPALGTHFVTRPNVYRWVAERTADLITQRNREEQVGSEALALALQTRIDELKALFANDERMDRLMVAAGSAWGSAKVGPEDA